MKKILYTFDLNGVDDQNLKSEVKYFLNSLVPNNIEGYAQHIDYLLNYRFVSLVSKKQTALQKDQENLQRLEIILDAMNENLIHKSMAPLYYISLNANKKDILFSIAKLRSELKNKNDQTINAIEQQLVTLENFMNTPLDDKLLIDASVRLRDSDIGSHVTQFLQNTTNSQVLQDKISFILGLNTELIGHTLSAKKTTQSGFKTKMDCATQMMTALNLFLKENSSLEVMLKPISDKLIKAIDILDAERKSLEKLEQTGELWKQQASATHHSLLSSLNPWLQEVKKFTEKKLIQDVLKDYQLNKQQKYEKKKKNIISMKYPQQLDMAHFAKTDVQLNSSMSQKNKEEVATKEQMQNETQDETDKLLKELISSLPSFLSQFDFTPLQAKLNQHKDKWNALSLRIASKIPNSFNDTEKQKLMAIQKQVNALKTGVIQARGQDEIDKLLNELMASLPSFLSQFDFTPIQVKLKQHQEKWDQLSSRISSKIPNNFNGSEKQKLIALQKQINALKAPPVVVSEDKLLANLVLDLKNSSDRSKFIGSWLEKNKNAPNLDERINRHMEKMSKEDVLNLMSVQNKLMLLKSTQNLSPITAKSQKEFGINSIGSEPKVFEKDYMDELLDDFLNQLNIKDINHPEFKKVLGQNHDRWEILLERIEERLKNDNTDANLNVLKAKFETLIKTKPGTRLLVTPQMMQDNPGRKKEIEFHQFQNKLIRQRLILTAVGVAITVLAASLIIGSGVGLVFLPLALLIGGVSAGLGGLALNRINGNKPKTLDEWLTEDTTQKVIVSDKAKEYAKKPEQLNKNQKEVSNVVTQALQNKPPELRWQNQSQKVKQNIENKIGNTTKPGNGG